MDMAEEIVPTKPNMEQNFQATGDSSFYSADNLEAEGALRKYGERFKSVEDSAHPVFNRQAFAWHAEHEDELIDVNQNEEEVRAELVRDLGSKLGSTQDDKRGNTTNSHPFRDALPRRKLDQKPQTMLGTRAEDSDKEQVCLCVQCGLPLGDFTYKVRHGYVHGECMAQRVLEDMKKEDKERRQKDFRVKQSRREEFDIGWKADRIPCNKGLAERMDCSFMPEGMCCLVLQEMTRAVQIAPTVEPAASVNLEYLAIAMKVRRQEGREPLFSLDPVDSASDSMQVKRFEPEWLAGTSVGDVLFQADYHLKELSMGEYEQPIVGMKSCFDYSWDEGEDMEWRAREWFVVRKAEVHLSQDDVVIPYVKMGVEAWEQVVGMDGNVVDAKVTRRNHPLLKYAQSFTYNFDLIAERKSVIFHLRELAKASVLAKYLVDADVTGVDVETHVDDVDPDSLMIPQLWNERHVGKIQVKDGTIVNANEGIGTCRHGVYGGVSFGLDRFKVSAPARVSRSVLEGTTARPAAAVGAARASITGAQAFAAPARAAIASSRAFVPPARAVTAGAQAFAAPARAAIASTQAFAAPARAVTARAPAFAAPARAAIASTQAFAAPARAAIAGAQPFAARRAFAPPAIGPQGVDLNLDKFELAEPTRVDTHMASGHLGVDACAAIGKVFWSNLDGIDESVFKDEDKTLLKRLLAPHLSDRRNEADQFIPPDTSRAYVERLNNLMKEEDVMRADRLDHFFSTKFVASDPGPLFPSSWKDLIEIERARVPGRTDGPPHEGMLHERSDYKAKAHMFDHLLKSATPVFDKSAEDGIRFRVYKVGSLEVRTFQEPNDNEIVGMVFSTRAPTKALMQAEQDQKVKDHEQLTKTTVYVERDRMWPTHHRYYVALETEMGNTVTTEMLWDGTVAWKENPADSEDRKSLSKVFLCNECNGKGVTVQDMREYQRKSTDRKRVGTFHSSGKRYAQAVHDRVCGATEKAGR